MIASLRPFARSRCLRAMGVLAWLMLVVTSVAAAPMGMQAQDAQPIQATTSITGTNAHCHDGGPASDSAAHLHHQPDCCGSQAMPGCHCAAMCASAVPTTLTMIAAVRLSTSYRMPPRIVAPAPNSAPPLRPPLA
ncbi:MAG: hypothetical protein ABIY56_00445 [Dokdonella sp.]